jgi:hypothetical protein
MRLSPWHAAIQLCMVRVEPVGAVNQISKAVVILDVVKVAYLKSVRPRADKSAGNQGVDVPSCAYACPIKFHR